MQIFDEQTKEFLQTSFSIAVNTVVAFIGILGFIFLVFAFLKYADKSYDYWFPEQTKIECQKKEAGDE